jgi:hypothetical protein
MLIITAPKLGCLRPVINSLEQDEINDANTPKTNTKLY